MIAVEHSKQVARNEITKAARRYAQKKTPRLIQYQGGKCFWCREEIVSAKEAKKSKVLIGWYDVRSIVLKTPKGLRIVRQASVDHLVPLASGRSSSDFLVASCVDCNQKKGAKAHF